MKNILTLLALTAAVSAFAFLKPAMAGEETMNKKIDISIKKLDGLTSAEGFKLTSDLYVVRRDNQKELIEYLSSKKPSKETKVFSAYLLGLHRMKAAVPALTENITLTATLTPFPSEKPWSDSRVALEALTKIGLPAIPAMIELIENTEDKIEREYAATVIQRVHGTELGRFVLQKAIKKQSDKKKKKALMKVLMLKLFE